MSQRIFEQDLLLPVTRVHHAPINQKSTGSAGATIGRGSKVRRCDHWEGIQGSQTINHFRTMRTPRSTHYPHPKLNQCCKNHSRSTPSTDPSFKIHPRFTQDLPSIRDPPKIYPNFKIHQDPSTFQDPTKITLYLRPKLQGPFKLHDIDRTKVGGCGVAGQEIAECWE